MARVVSFPRASDGSPSSERVHSPEVNLCGNRDGEYSMPGGAGKAGPSGEANPSPEDASVLGGTISTFYDGGGLL